MAYYRKNAHVGWVDEHGTLYPLTTAPAVILNTDLTECYAAVGEWYDDGFHCRFCNKYLGYEGRGSIDGKTACFECEADSDTVTEYVPDKRLDGKQYRRGTPGRLDVNGVEWWACDPYPTWYRRVDGVLHAVGANNFGGVHERHAAWAD